MTLSNIFRESEFLRPSILLVLGTLFLLAISPYVPSAKGLFIVFLSILVFTVGEFLGERTFKPGLDISKKHLHYIGSTILIIALAALYLDFFTAGGIPIFNASIRRFLSPQLTSLAFLMAPGTVILIASRADKKHAKLTTLFLMFFTAGMMALLGYRTEIMVALIASVIVAYYCDIFDIKELLALVLIAFLALSGISFLRAGGIAYSGRSATTLAAFDFMVDETGTFGLTHGYVQFADVVKRLSTTPVYGGRNLVSNLVGGRAAVSITSTLYGPPFIDFGVAGFVVFLIFGILLGASYKAANEKKGVYAVGYAMLLTFLLLGIETGITDLIVWAYFSIAGMFYLLAHGY